MALNKKMHPRNIYKHPPNFKQLALRNEEFRKVAKVDLRGKVSIDFKDAAALRALTKALLLCDWDLDVIIPPDKLVPTLPLRLNYILWIEDLMKSHGSDSPVYGIDVGTGSSCVYPLLCAKKNLWHMVGTEKDIDCFACAKENVQRNNLQSLISVLKVTGESIFMEVFADDSISLSKIAYDFSICNPPFYASDEELDSNKNNRSQKRTPPHNARTGSAHEVIVSGGEIAFILQMIEESLVVKDKIRIFSTMLGRKASVSVILNALKEKDVKEVTQTEFCQGHVTRWGIAWSFSVPLSLAPTHGTSAKKQKPPMRFEVPPLNTLDGENQLSAVTRKLKYLLDKLEMQHKQVAKGVSSFGYQVTAFSNTWSNQRRKRREELHKLTQEEATKISASCCESQDDCSENQSSTDEIGPPCKQIKLDESVPLLVMSIVIREEVKGMSESQVVLEMDSLRDFCNRDMIHQVMQYFRNNLNK